LKSLDFDLGGDDVTIGNKGSGKINNERAAQARTDSEKDREVARDILHNHHFDSSQDRRIWALHADGVGTPTIADQLGIGRAIARKSISTTRAAWLARKTRKPKSPDLDTVILSNIKQADPLILMALLKASRKF
jgi:hypothetical protein